MAKSKTKEDLVLGIGADIRPFEKAMGEIQRSLTGRFRSHAGQALGLGSGGLLGVLSADTLLDNQLAESYEASQVLQPGSEDAAGTLRNIRQGFARHAIDINPAEIAHTFRGAADTMLTGKGGVDQMGEILTYAGLPTDKESLRYMQENPIDSMAAYLAGGARSKYKESHPGLYRWALNQLGLTEVHQTFDTLGVGMGVRDAIMEDSAGTFEGARAAYWLKLMGHEMGVSATRASHSIGSEAAEFADDFTDYSKARQQGRNRKMQMREDRRLEAFKERIFREIDEENRIKDIPYDSSHPRRHSIEWWKHTTKPNE